MPIAISLSPNTEKEDILLALKMLFSPGQWIKGRAITELEEAFRKYFGMKYAVSFSSGRMAQCAILKAAGIDKNDEVLLQAFTCVVVPNSIIVAGANPIYVDIEEDSLNIDPADLEKKITRNSKAIIVQHTFGKPAKIREIKEIAKKHNLLVVEDCAHCLGATFEGKKLGTFGDVAFFSFGRDKVISSVFGGIAITDDPKIGKNLLKIQNGLSYPSPWWVFQQLLHPLAFSIILPVYNFFGLGKFLLWFSQKVSLLSRAVTEEEKSGKLPQKLLVKFPNALAVLTLSQFKKLEKYNKKREELAQMYRQGLSFDELKHLPKITGEIYLRYPIVTKKSKNIISYAKERGIVLGDWYQNVIDPKGTDLAKVGYQWGTCLAAEKIAKNVLNLPTYPKMKTDDARQIVEAVKRLL